MSGPTDNLQTCSECGATVYPEHIDAHTAGLWKGSLLCPHCMAEKKRLTQPAAAEELAEPDVPRISLVDDDEQGARTRPAIRTFAAAGGITMHQAAEAAVSYRRPLQPDSPYALRCRTFHSKLNDASLAHLDRMINEWVDGHDDVRIKFATTTIGVFEGKHADPNLIVNVFY